MFREFEPGRRKVVIAIGGTLLTLAALKALGLNPFSLEEEPPDSQPIAIEPRPRPWTGQTSPRQIGDETLVFDLRIKTFDYPSLTADIGTVLGEKVRGFHRYPQTWHRVEGEELKPLRAYLRPEEWSKGWNFVVEPNELIERRMFQTYYIKTRGGDNAFFAVGPFPPPEQGMMFAFKKSPASRPDLTAAAWVDFPALPNSKWVVFATQGPLSDIKNVKVTIATQQGPIDIISFDRRALQGLDTTKESFPQSGLYQLENVAKLSQK